MTSASLRLTRLFDAAPPRLALPGGPPLALPMPRPEPLPLDVFVGPGRLALGPSATAAAFSTPSSARVEASDTFAKPTPISVRNGRFDFEADGVIGRQSTRPSDKSAVEPCSTRAAADVGVDSRQRLEHVNEIELSSARNALSGG